jgi:hypothetical protein
LAAAAKRQRQAEFPDRLIACLEATLPTAPGWIQLIDQPGSVFGIEQRQDPLQPFQA